MKNYDLTKYLGSTKFCDFDTAIFHAKIIGTLKAWDYVFKRSDFKLSSVLKVAESVNSEPLWKIVVELPAVKDFLTGSMLDIALLYAEKVQNENVYLTVFERHDFNAAQIVELGINLNSRLFWKAATQLPEVREHLISLVESEKSFNAKKFGYNEDVASVVLGSNNLTSPEYACSCANELGNSNVWKAFLMREDIGIGSIIEFWSKNAKTSGAITDILTREDAKKLLDGMTENELLRVAEIHSDHNLWKHILSIPKVNTFITKGPLDEVTKFAEKVNSEQLWKLVFTRSDFSHLRALEIARSHQSHDLLILVLQNPSLKPEYAITHMLDCMYTKAYEVVFEREDIKKYLLTLAPAEAVSLVVKINKLEFFNLVLKRVDVQKYLFSRKK